MERRCTPSAPANHNGDVEPDGGIWKLNLISPSEPFSKEQILCSMDGYDGIASPSNVPLAFRGVIIEDEDDMTKQSKFKPRSARFQSHPPLHHLSSLSPPQQTHRQRIRNAETFTLTSHLEKQNLPSRLHPQASVLLRNLTCTPPAHRVHQSRHPQPGICSPLPRAIHAPSTRFKLKDYVCHSFARACCQAENSKRRDLLAGILAEGKMKKDDPPPGKFVHPATRLLTSQPLSSPVATSRLLLRPPSSPTAQHHAVTRDPAQTRLPPWTSPFRSPTTTAYLQSLLLFLSLAWLLCGWRLGLSAR